jgi:hypothetical protein
MILVNAINIMVTSIYSTNNFGIEANLSSDSIPLETLEQAYGLVQEKLQNFADDLEFSHKLDLAFGNSFDPQVAQNFRQSW